MAKRMNIESLVQECFQHYLQTHNTSLPITSPSIPILYFGDYPSYTKSETKIITVGLNPSHREFPPEDRFLRFRKAEKVSKSSNLTHLEIQLFLDSLNDYYKDEPYSKWFGCFEPMLNGLNSSYYENEYPNRALHTDICSPLATDITWSKLKDRQRARLSNEGNKMWHNLVEILAPDFILISVARRHLDKIRFKRTRWQESIRITQDKNGEPRDNPYVVSTSTYTINGKKGILVFGKAANTPFGLISNVQKQEIGDTLRTRMIFPRPR